MSARTSTQVHATIVDDRTQYSDGTILSSAPHPQYARDVSRGRHGRNMDHHKTRVTVDPHVHCTGRWLARHVARHRAAVAALRGRCPAYAVPCTRSRALCRWTEEAAH